MSETRKIQKIGNTLYISIPKSWTKQLLLKQGEKITLVPQQDGSITLYPKTRDQRPREITLHVNSKSSVQSLKRGIIAAYLDGFDTIELVTEKAFTGDQQESIREITKSLFGLEIIEVTSNTVAIECLLKQEMPIDKTLNRIHNVILSMFSEMILALETQNVDLKRLTRGSKDFKRLSLVTNRLLRSIILFPKPSQEDEITLIDCVDYLQILHITSGINGRQKKVAKTITSLIGQQLPKSITKLMIEAITQIRKTYDEAIQALLSKDILLANKILDRSFTLRSLWSLCVDANGKSQISSLSLANVRLLIDSLEQIHKDTHEIANIAIDRTEAVDTRHNIQNFSSIPKRSIFYKKLDR